MRTGIVLVALFAIASIAGYYAWPVQDSENPFAEEDFYVDPKSSARRQAEEWRASRPEDARQMEKIASGAGTYYFSEWTETTPGGTVGQVDRRVSLITEAGALPVLGAYAIPERDCGGYASGGFSDGKQYSRWIRDYAAGIGDRKIIVILEPDALADASCLSAAERSSRFALIKDAVTVLKQRPRTSVYIDAGNPGWQSASTMAYRLRRAGVVQADGFSLNVSNFFGTRESIAYGEQISGWVDGKHFVVDTSRNGLGRWESDKPEAWCNPPGRALGSKPTADTGNELVDAYYWMKWPGESDGTCRGWPSAGTFVPEYALGLARRSSY